jgi:hypothetical protein
MLRDRQGHGWTANSFDRALRALSWLCERRKMEHHGISGCYVQLNHQTVREFLTSEEYAGPTRLDLEETHAHIGIYYCRQAEAEADWQRVDPYGRFYAVRHLLRANDRTHLATAADLLTRLDYLQATLGDEPPDNVAPGAA